MRTEIREIKQVGNCEFDRDPACSCSSVSLEFTIAESNGLKFVFRLQILSIAFIQFRAD